MDEPPKELESPCPEQHGEALSADLSVHRSFRKQSNGMMGSDSWRPPDDWPTASVFECRYTRPGDLASLVPASHGFFVTVSVGSIIGEPVQPKESDLNPISVTWDCFEADDETSTIPGSCGHAGVHSLKTPNGASVQVKEQIRERWRRLADLCNRCACQPIPGRHGGVSTDRA